MTVRRFRNPEVPGPNARTVKMGDITIEAGETVEVDLPRLQMWAHSSPDGSGGELLGEVDQRCPDLLEEVDAPAGLVFELGDVAVAPVVAPTSGSLVVDSAPPATEPAEE